MPSIGVNLTGKSTKDVDSRTIFVSNVHFVVTKDSLSQHFNKFRDVFILTGAALGLEDLNPLFFL
ncbi:putative nuclear polyadenylated RNA-binding protein Nab2/ZC3H14 [Helianthus annuus]|nr:putative nuclear polyadenylated RNA-binding protein Nab2/ZC3H14 [Helianthus annuus]